MHTRIPIKTTAAVEPSDMVVHIHAAADGIAARHMRQCWPADVTSPMILQSDIIPGQQPREGPAEHINAINEEGKRITNRVVQPMGSVDFSAVLSAPPRCARDAC
jgi:hypothetical protein